MDWLRAAHQLRAEGRPGVLVTVIEVRGHAPRDAGAKLVVDVDRSWGSIGGGNLEASAIARARKMITDQRSGVITETIRLNPHERTEFGRQCCGGEVTLLYELLAVRPSVAIFGIGHVGFELARIVSRWEVRLHLIDSRDTELDPLRLVDIVDGIADVEIHRVVVGESVLERLPTGSHVLIMTHDHAEDFALCDAALRLPAPQLGSIGLIGSSAKWTHFQAQLAIEGHPAERIQSISCPIGLPAISGKQPALIAVSVAAGLLQQMGTEALEDLGSAADPGP